MKKHFQYRIFIGLLFLTAIQITNAQSAAKYKNQNLSIDERVQDLVARMTLDEKISLLGYNSAAIPRLGIPAYNWWNEALHGVARAGTATIFPQSIGLAATFNDELIGKVANVISTEARAKYNLAIAKDTHVGAEDMKHMGKILI